MDTLAQRHCSGEFPLREEAALILSFVDSGAYSLSTYRVHKEMVSLLVPVASSPYAHCGDFSPGSGGWLVNSVDKNSWTHQ